MIEILVAYLSFGLGFGIACWIYDPPEGGIVALLPWCILVIIVWPVVLIVLFSFEAAMRINRTRR